MPIEIKQRLTPTANAGENPEITDGTPRVGGHALPTCAPSLTRSFTCCEPVATGACYPASSRARAPFTITFVPGKMRASWSNCNGRFMSRRA
jgi:hypothetical protein